MKRGLIGSFLGRVIAMELLIQKNSLMNECKGNMSLIGTRIARASTFGELSVF